jgi:hypothetical protein
MLPERFQKLLASICQLEYFVEPDNGHSSLAFIRIFHRLIGRHPRPNGQCRCCAPGGEVRWVNTIAHRGISDRVEDGVDGIDQFIDHHGAVWGQAT